MRNGDGVIARCVKFLAVLLAMAGLAACALDPDSFDAGGDAGIDVTLVPISVIGGPGAPGLGPGGTILRQIATSLSHHPYRCDIHWLTQQRTQITIVLQF